MQDIFKVYIDRLKTDGSEEIKIEADPSFLETDEKELTFKKKVHIAGRAYIAHNDLVLDLEAKASYNMPCAICNKTVENDLFIKRLIQTVELELIKDSVFDFSNLVRNEILLQVPNFAECNSGNCKQRKKLSEYLIKSNETYYPFQELEL